MDIPGFPSSNPDFTYSTKILKDICRPERLFCKCAFFLENLFPVPRKRVRDRRVSDGICKLRILDRNRKLRCLISISWQQINLLALCPCYLEQKAFIHKKGKEVSAGTYYLIC